MQKVASSSPVDPSGDPTVNTPSTTVIHKPSPSSSPQKRHVTAPAVGAGEIAERKAALEVQRKRLMKEKVAAEDLLRGAMKDYDDLCGELRDNARKWQALDQLELPL